MSYYLHMGNIVVQKGDVVERGQLIGGSGGSSSLNIAAHLHLTVKLNGIHIDPASVVLKEIDVPKPEKLTPVEAIVVAVDGTVPPWDQQLSVQYTATRDEEGTETHVFVLSKEDRERVEELAKNVKF